MSMTRTVATAFLLCSGSFLNAQNPTPCQLVVQEVGGWSGFRRLLELNDSGAIRFEYHQSRKAKAQVHKSTISTKTAKSMIERMTSLLTALEVASVNRAKCFDGTTYIFSIRVGNYQRSWIFFNMTDLHSASPAMGGILDDISKSAPQAFRIFTCMPQPPSE